MRLQPLGLAAQPPLKPCSLLGRLGQATDELTSSKAHIPYLAVGKSPQNGQIGLMFALRDNGGDEVIDNPNNAARKKPCGPLSRIRGRVSDIAQNAHGEPSLEEFGPPSPPAT